MKKISLLLFAITGLLFLSCEGPAGPPGPPGFDGFDGIDGQDGITVLGKVLEIEGTFSSENEYVLFYEFPLEVEVFESDIVLVYILWEQFEDTDGEFVDVWRLLPQTRLLDQGILQYNFDHTFFDVSIFLESDFDLSTLGAADTDNQIFRVAILPAEFGKDETFDPTNLDAVMTKLQIDKDLISRQSLD
ncbi:MAG: collagen-like protein [Flavobacteriaceae bacterium]|nr:collagen-like protein [Flavobacteriaceae bacterium]